MTLTFNLHKCTIALNSNFFEISTKDKAYPEQFSHYTRISLFKIQRPVNNWGIKRRRPEHISAKVTRRCNDRARLFGMGRKTAPESAKKITRNRAIKRREESARHRLRTLFTIRSPRLVSLFPQFHHSDDVPGSALLRRYGPFQKLSPPHRFSSAASPFKEFRFGIECSFEADRAGFYALLERFRWLPL